MFWVSELVRESNGSCGMLRYRRGIVAGVLTGVLALSGCGDEVATDEGGDSPAVASVDVTPETETLFSLGQTAQFAATAMDSQGREVANATLEWSSSDPEVASVDAGGEVTGVSSGSADIIAAAGDAEGSSTVWVDPEKVLQDYCAKCHGPAIHVVTMTPAACPECHSMNLDPTAANHRTLSNGHIVASDGFDLLGAHELLICTNCHDSSGAPKTNPASDTDCISCHEGDYQAQHAGSGYPTICLNCHTTSSWGGGAFDHEGASDGFRLLGAHAQLACASCHDPTTGDPIYDPADDSDCYACHDDDYQREHSGSGYPTTCLTCHSANSFDGASFNHDSQYFPIFSGKHKEKWDDCTTCHTDSSDYRVFTCFNCHKHNREDMNDKHSGREGYSYDSARCLACHPNGEN